MSRLVVPLFLAFILSFSPGAVSAPADGAQQQTILMFGARGKIGRMIVAEALERGHKVVGVSRKPGKLKHKSDNFSAVKGDVTDPASFRSTLAGVDAIVISVGGNGDDNIPENSVQARAARTAVAVLTDTPDAPRIIQIGGATTMYGDREAMLANLPMPAREGSRMYGIFFGHRVALDIYEASDIEWTVVVPPLDILGWSPWRISSKKRTGNYRTSTTALVRDTDGKSEIYVADLAVAVVDEIENRKFRRQRFTVGY